MRISSMISFHGVTNIAAHTHDDLSSAPLIISMEAADWRNGSGEITIHTDDKELAAALVTAINGAVAAVKASRALQSAATEKEPA